MSNKEGFLKFLQELKVKYPEYELIVQEMVEAVKNHKEK